MLLGGRRVAFVAPQVDKEVMQMEKVICAYANCDRYIPDDKLFCLDHYDTMVKKIRADVEEEYQDEL